MHPKTGTGVELGRRRASDTGWDIIAAPDVDLYDEMNARLAPERTKLLRPLYESSGCRIRSRSAR